MSESESSSYSQSGLVEDSGALILEEYSDTVPIERKAQILKLVTAHPKWNIRTIQKLGGKEFKYSSYKKRWEDHVKKGGTTFEKYKYIDKYVYRKFEESRKDFKFVKERDLQLWGIQAAQSFRDPDFMFKAGPSWIYNFKQRHGITSRKVNKLVGRREVMSMDTILLTAKLFQQNFRQFTVGFQQSQIFNTDQVGFMYEIVGNRTLSFRGEKDTFGVAKSPTNLATHSYTVQYLISMDGKITGDVFVCLQERTGKLGPNIKNQLFPASNVSVTCSTSGKLTTSLYEYWLEQVVMKSIKEDFLLMIDSWPGQTNSAIYADRFGLNGLPNCTLKIIPKKCTSICQPLDTTFHRQLKYFARAIYSEASLRYSTDTNPVDEITTRNNIVRMHSLLHNQLSAPIFESMIKYSWYSAGLTDDRPVFLPVKDACFAFEKSDGPLCSSGCGNTRFMKCAYCRAIFCFVCFYYNYHFH